MRPLLLLLVLLGASTLAAPDWKRVFNSFFPSEPNEPLHKNAMNYYGEIEPEAEPIHARIKRAVLAAMGFASPCSAGWTGQFCENPICVSNTTVPIEQNTDKVLDLFYAPSGCTGLFYVPVDSTCDYLFIQVNTDGPVPWINITDSNGNLVVPRNIYPNSGMNMNFYQPITPGVYQLSIDTQQMPTTLCAVNIQATSKLDITHGFVDNPQDDVPAHGEAAGQGKLQNLIIHTYHPEIRSVPKVATILRQRSTTPLLRSVLTTRYGCAYEQYMGGTFGCLLNNLYTLTVDGIDANGFAFRRTKAGWACIEAPPTPPPPTTPAPQTCLNGGTLLYEGTPNAQCLCRELFTGPTCSIPQCMNGGFLNPAETSCLCQTGYLGINCQNIICVPNFGEYLTDYSTLVVVWRAVQAMNPYVAQYAQAFYNEMQFMGETPGFQSYQSFILITYANGVLTRNSYGQQEWDRFYADFQALNATTTVGNCNDTSIAAITEVFRLTTYNKSPIYHFTDAPASDSQNFLSVSEMNGYKKLPVWSFFHNTSAAIQCKVDEISEGYRVLGTLSYMSGGLTMGLSNDKFNQTFALAMRTTNYKSNQVLIDDLTVCTIDGYRTFFVDSATKAIYIVATGDNLLVAVTNPDGKITSPLAYQDGRNYFYTIQGNNLTRGEWLLQFNAFQSTYPCSYRVYAQSDYDLFVGVTNAIYTDAYSAEPIVGMPNAIVAQINGIYNNIPDQFRLFAEVMIVSNEDGNYHKPLYFSNGVYRTGCGYHLYFGVTDFCERAGQVFYAMVYADDPFGYTIQRTAVGYCAGRAPTQLPPTSCINGGVPDPNNATLCLCPPLYTGRYCQDYNCQNGAIYSNGLCQCPPGLGGTFCEQQQCLVSNIDPPFTQDGQSMTFVVSTIPSMNATWQMLAANVQEFVKDIQLHSPKWITRYNLIIINQKEAVLVSQATRASNFVTAIQTIASDLTPYYNASITDCKVLLATGMLLGVQNSIPKSSVFIFADSNAADESNPVYAQLTAQIEGNQIQVNLIGTVDPSVPLCGTSNGWFDQAIQDLVIFSAGWMYSTKNVHQFYNFILTEYSNGIILDQYADDCTSPQIYYLPVDSAAQSMTIVANGLNVNITVTQPNGNSALNSNYELNMIQEDWMVIDQYMIPCPNTDWQYFERNCMNFILTRIAFRDASNRCHALGGWMVDIYYQGKQDYVQYHTNGADNWIGLYMIGTTWYWDVDINNDPVPLTPNSYSNWKDGVTPTDPSMGCAVMGKDGFWAAVACTDSYYPVCQRHRYGQEVVPNDPTTNLLPAGFWKVAVQASNGSCAIQARVQSTIQLYFGFVQDTHSDYPMLYANSNASNNYFAVGATGLNMFPDDRHPSNEGRLNYIYTGSNESAFDALTVEDRASCSYQYLSQNFSCQRRGAYYQQFFVRFSGLDQYGHTFDRLISAYCGIYQTRCDNDGYEYQGQCICQPGWTGNRCQVPVCLNGGVINSLTNKCSCPTAYGGPNCQFAYCEPPYPVSYASTNRTLAIALETSTLMATSIYMLKRNITSVINQITNGSGVPQWWDSYILFPFDSTSNKASWFPPIYSNNFSDIVAGLNAIPRGCPNNTCDQTICQRPYLRIIADIVAHPSFRSPNSDILVISRASPEDYNLESQVIGAIQDSRARVFFLLAGASTPCNEGWSTPAVTAMNYIASYSQGGIYPLSPTEMVFNWLGVYFPASYRSGWVTGGAVKDADCSDAEWIFPVENSATHLLIDYFGNTKAISLIAPDGNQETLPTSLVTSSTNYLGVFPLQTNGATKAGNWIVKIQDPDTPQCSLDLRVRSAIEIYPAFTQPSDQYNGATNDNGHFQPLIGEQNIVLAHESTFGEGASIQYVQIVVPNRGLYFTSEMALRSDSCGYEYYSTKAFECYMENFWVIFYGTDMRGAPLNRMFVTHCISNRPTPPPPPPFCDITQTLNDIVFMVDGSVAASKVFGTFKLFMDYVARGYSISSTSTQIGAFSFSNTAGGASAFLLNVAPDQTSLTQKLLSLSNDGQAGQNITSAINYVQQYTAQGSGYRVSSQVKHLVVYVTASTSYTDGGLDPKAAVQSMVRGGSFGFAVVSLGFSDAPDWLVSLAGPGCSYFTNDENDFATNAGNLIQSISCYRQNICNVQ
ncbi:unnamed protein product, partial [Mesorhabditis belari]|uniref:Uncharacterized protein n=1 Tax=Mesorhabditis belari TaxID=2138241 RepID=A0AAF3EZ22_9BILA